MSTSEPRTPHAPSQENSVGARDQHLGTLVREHEKALLAYTEKLLASVPEMDPDWLDNLLARRALPV